LGDGIISISETPQDFAEVRQRVKGYAREYGRDRSATESTFYMTVNLNRDEAQARREADTYLKAYYGVNIWEDLWGPWGPPEMIAERIGQYHQAGAETVIVRFASFQPMVQLETFLQDVVPRLI
jgi:alkanesulfonate monooxygenase SsuD/methylene tetrahydromethanopterin reductase-like flavin-dependent oxidoreductase (luciferase family)